MSASEEGKKKRKRFQKRYQAKGKSLNSPEKERFFLCIAPHPFTFIITLTRHLKLYPKSAPGGLVFFHLVFFHLFLYGAIPEN